MPNPSLRTALHFASRSAALGVALFLSAGALAQVTSTGNVSPPVAAPAGGTASPGNFLGVGTAPGNGNGAVTVEGAGTTLDIAGAGPASAALSIGSTAGTGELTIQDGGAVNLDSTGTGSSVLYIGTDVSGGNAPTLDGTVTIDNGTLGLSSTNGDSILGVGRHGQGTLNATNSTISVISSSATEQPGVHVGGSGTGSNAASDGTVVLNNSSLDVISHGGGTAFVNVGANGAGALTVENGSEVVILNTTGGSSVMTVGRNGNAGAALVTGAGSSVSMESSLTVGRGAGSTGAMTIEDGGQVSVAGGTGISRVGRDSSTGTMDVTTGGGLSTTTLRIGDGAGSDGTINVSSGGTVDVSGLFDVGYSSTGALFVGDNPATGGVETGGTVTAGPGLRIGTLANGSGTVAVNGGGTIDATDVLSVGLSGTGVLSIGDNPATGGVEAGGTVNGVQTFVGQLVGSSGAVTVNNGGALNLTGLDSFGNGAVLIVGRDGQGQMTVENGSVLVDSTVPSTGTEGGLIVGGSSTAIDNAGNGQLNVGTGGSVTVATGFVQIGRNTAGEMNVTGGGLVDSSAVTTSVVGRIAGAGNGTVNVTGPGSTWLAGNTLVIGANASLGTGAITGPGGTGLVNIANGGQLFANDIVNGAGGTLTGGGGTITGNIVNHGVLAAGNSPGIMSVVGNLTLASDGINRIELGGIVFNSGSSTYEYDRVEVDGDVTVEDGATFDVSYFGAFTASLGDFFDVLVADTFAFLDMSSWNFLLPALAGGLSWDTGLVAFSETQSALRLQVVGDSAVPAPATALLFGPVLAGLLLMRRRRKA